MSETQQPCFAFGPFELDLRRGELRREGAAVPLAPQPFKALSLLVTRAGALVTREELRRELWGDDSHVDVRAGLNFCVAQLRQALDDPAARSHYLIAVPRRGYRFAAPVGPLTAVPASAPVDAAKRLPRWALPALVAAAIAAGLAGGVALGRTDALPGARPVSLAALARFERASEGLADASPTELLDRIRAFEAALEADPSFAEAYAGLAEAWLIVGNYRARPPQEAYASAKAAAGRALALDPDLGAAQATYGASVMYLHWDWAGAGPHLERAAALEPRSPRAHRWLARFLTARGDHERAVRHARQAVELEPSSPSAWTSLGVAEFYAGVSPAAIADCEHAVALMPAFEPARWCADAARAALRSDGAFWQQRLETLLRSWKDRCDPPALSIAAALTRVGERSRALDLLEREANRRNDALLFAAAHPELRRLRGEPRFTHLLERLGLT